MDNRNNKRANGRIWRNLGDGCHALLLICGVLVAVQPSKVFAEAAASEPGIRELLLKLEERDRKLAERDELIGDLQRRVGQLEKRLGAAQTAIPSQKKPQKAPVPRPSSNASAQAKRPAGPGTFEVDEEAAERALERTLTQAGALLLPFGMMEIQPFFTYARRETDIAGPVLAVASPSPLFPLGLSGTQINTRRDEFTPGIFTRVGLPLDSQFELSIPYRVVDQSINVVGINSENNNSGSSIGDISVGLAKTLLREKGWLPDIVTRITWNTGSGSRVNNGVNLFQGFSNLNGQVVVLKRQDPLVFTGTFYYQGSFEKDHFQPGDQYGFNIGTWLAASPETSLFLQLQQDFLEKSSFNGVQIAGSDRVSSTFVLGGSTLLGRGVLITLSAGIGLTDSAPDYTVNLSMPIRFDLPVN